MAKALFNKYVWLIDTIYRSGPLSYQEINDKWMRSCVGDGESIPMRTFHNHRKAIEETFGIEIKCSKKCGYKYFIGNEDLFDFKELKYWILNSFSVNNILMESKSIKDRILFENIPSGRKYLIQFIEAMKENHSVEIQYQSYLKQEPEKMLINPYCLKLFHQRWYVVAENPMLCAVHIYALDRIMNMRVYDIPFYYPDDFNPNEYFAKSFGIIVEDRKAEEITVRVRGSKIKYLRSLPLHSSQKETEIDADTSDFSYKVIPSYDFKQELLSHGNEIEVLSPEWLRNEFREKITSMLALYEKQ